MIDFKIKVISFKPAPVGGQTFTLEEFYTFLKKELDCEFELHEPPEPKNKYESLLI